MSPGITWIAWSSPRLLDCSLQQAPTHTHTDSSRHFSITCSGRISDTCSDQQPSVVSHRQLGYPSWRLLDGHIYTVAPLEEPHKQLLPLPDNNTHRGVSWTIPHTHDWYQYTNHTTHWHPTDCQTHTTHTTHNCCHHTDNRTHIVASTYWDSTYLSVRLQMTKRCIRVAMLQHTPLIILHMTPDHQNVSLQQIADK